MRNALFTHVSIFRPAYIYPVEPRKEPNVSYRLLRAVYKPIFENRDIRAMFASLSVK